MVIRIIAIKSIIQKKVNNGDIFGFYNLHKVVEGREL